MKKMLGVIGCVVLAVVIGAGSAVWAINNVARNTWLQNGPWRTNPRIGSSDLGIYSRAAVARAGLFALTRSETVYYMASEDDDGRALEPGAVYRVEGEIPEARWWSITLYGEDFFLVPNSENRYSFSLFNLVPGPDGTFSFRVSSDTVKGDWLPSPKSGKFHLNLRLYEPDKKYLETPGMVKLPRIIREAGR